MRVFTVIAISLVGLMALGIVSLVISKADERPRPSIVRDPVSLPASAIQKIIGSTQPPPGVLPDVPVDFSGSTETMSLEVLMTQLNAVQREQKALSERQKALEGRKQAIKRALAKKIDERTKQLQEEIEQLQVLRQTYAPEAVTNPPARIAPTTK